MWDNIIQSNPLILMVLGLVFIVMSGMCVQSCLKYACVHDTTTKIVSQRQGPVTPKLMDSIKKACE